MHLTVDAGTAMSLALHVLEAALDLHWSDHTEREPT